MNESGGCGRGMEDAVRYHDGELPPAERAAFEGHLAGCPDCQRSLDAAAVALGGFDAFVGGEAPPLDVDEALRAVGQGEARARAARGRRRRRWAILGIGLAAAALLVAILLGRRSPRAPVVREEIARPPVKLPARRMMAPRRTSPAPPGH